MKRKYFDVGDKKFTLRQMQILSMLRDGLVHKEIGEKINTDKGTVDHSVSHMFHSRGFKNSKEMVGHASSHGLEPNGKFKGKNLFKGFSPKPPKKPGPPRAK